MRIPSLIFNGASSTAQKPVYRQFLRALEDPQAAQAELLAGYLRNNKSTTYGRRYRFESIASTGAYQRALPLSTFAEYAQAFEGILRGHEDVLTAEKVSAMTPARPLGTGSGPMPLLPRTAGFRAEVGRAVSAWYLELTRSRTQLLGGPVYWFVPPSLSATGTVLVLDRHEDLSARSGITEVGGGPLARLRSLGSDVPPDTVDATGSHAVFAPGGDSRIEPFGAWLDQSIRLLMDQSGLDCSDLRGVTDAHEWNRVSMLRLLAAKNLRIISAWDAAALVKLLDMLAENWESLLTELSSGRRAHGVVQGIAGDGRRAVELRRLGPASARAIWPRLSVATLWSSRAPGNEAEELARRLPDINIQSGAILTPEAIVSLPFGRALPLAVASHFIELVDEHGTAWPCWDARVGQEYEVAITTAAGLYRYKLAGRVRVTEYLFKTPCVVAVAD